MKHAIIEEIKKELYLVGKLNKPAVMEAYCDNMISFHIYDDDKSGYHEIGIITLDALYNEMQAVEILSSSDIKFLSCRYFGMNGIVPVQIGETKTFKG